MKLFNGSSINAQISKIIRDKFIPINREGSSSEDISTILNNHALEDFVADLQTLSKENPHRFQALYSYIQAAIFSVLTDNEGIGMAFEHFLKKNAYFMNKNNSLDKVSNTDSPKEVVQKIQKLLKILNLGDVKNYLSNS